MTGSPPRVLGRPPTLDLALLAVAVTAVSTSAPLVRYAAAPSLAIAFWRNALSLPFIGAWVAARPVERAAFPGRTVGERRGALLAGALLAAHFAAWIPSLSFTSVASSVALVATQPVWAALIARVRGHHVPAATWLGIATAFAGVVLLTGVDATVSGRALLGNLLALAGGALAAAYVTVGAGVRRTMPTGSYAAVCYAAAAAVLLAVCAASGQALVGYEAGTWLALAGLVLGPQLLGHTVVNRVLRTTSATVVSVAILFEIVGATLLAWIWFGETPSAVLWPAAALIGAGVVLVVRSARPASEPTGVAT